MPQLSFNCVLKLEQDTCGQYARDVDSAHQELGGCPSCVHRASWDTAKSRTSLNLQLVQLYVSYMQAKQNECTMVRDATAKAAELMQEISKFDEWGWTISLLDTVSLVSMSGVAYPHREELVMALSLWLLDRPQEAI